MFNINHHFCRCAAARCSFPDEWKGQYFQSGLGTVIIRKSLVTTKGTCIDQHRDYFLFANRFDDVNFNGT